MRNGTRFTDWNTKPTLSRRNSVSCFGVVLGDVVAADHDRALGRREQAAGDRQQRGLARARRAEQGDDLAVVDLQVAWSRATISASPLRYTLRTSRMLEHASWRRSFRRWWTMLMRHSRWLRPGRRW